MIIWRRFIPIGSSEEIEKLDQLVDDKNITREDLTLILKTIKLNDEIVDSI